MKVCKDRYGINHIETISATINLVRFLCLTLKEYERSELLLLECQDVVSQYSNVKGMDEFAITIGSLLATCYEEQNKINEAEIILKKYLKMNDDTTFTYSSHNYPDVISCTSQLAGIYLKLNNKFDQAIHLLKSCLTEKIKLYGHNHYETFKSINLLVQTFRSHNMKEKGDSLLRNYFGYRNKLPKKQKTSREKEMMKKKRILIEN